MSRRKSTVDNGFIRRSKVDPKGKKGLSRRRGVDEHVLTTVDGCSTNIEVGYVFPCASVATGKRHLFKVTRVDPEIDTVYGVVVERCPMPWWKWNSYRRRGLVDNDMLDDFSAKTEG